MLPLRLLCPGAGHRISHNLFQRGLRSSVCLEGFGSQMNDEDPVVIEREYNKYKTGESHGFKALRKALQGAFVKAASYSLSAAEDMIREAPEA